jgi:predicted permease
MMYGEVMHTPFENWNSRHSRWMATIGRIKTGTPLKKAEAELFAICKEQEAAEQRSLSNPKLAQAADRVVLVPAAHGFSYNADTIKKPLLILFAAVVLVLFIACANAANLILARGAARQREIAVRLAIGASRWRVISQLLTESLLIAALGGASGILVSLAGVRVLSWFMPNTGGNPADGIDPTLDWRLVAFTVAVCVLTGILSGLAPAWQSTRPKIVPTLKEDVPGSTGARRFTLRKGLVILQVALSLPLLAGAGLFARTLGNLRGLDSGFVQQNVSIASVDPMSFGYKAQRARDFYDRLCARVAALPGVRSASFADITPLSGSSWNGSVWVEGYATPSPKNNIFFNSVGARYFETVGTPVVLGRDFMEQDNPAITLELPEHLTPGTNLPDAPGKHVAIVNEAFARHFFGVRSAIGMHVGMGGVTSGDKLYEIAGVVKDARYFNMRETAEPMMFIPIWRRFVHRSELVIRTSGSTAQLAALLQREIHALDPVIPLENLHTLEHDIDENILVERMVATLSGVFGVLALLLSAVGLYGVIAYTVTRRTREIGIRIAIGAPRQSVLWLVLRDVLSMVLIGGVIGSLAAFLATRAIESILYGVSAHDPLSLMAAGLSLAMAALAASFLPARRATKIDPTVALRYE